MRPSFLLACLIALPAAAQTITVRTGPCPVKPSTPIPDADKAYAAGDDATAESLYTAKLPAPAAYLGVVNTQLDRNNLSAALATAQKFVAAAPASAEAQALLAQVLLRSGQVPEAAAPASRAYSTDHCSARALLVFAHFNDLTGRRLSAARELFAAHASDPADPEVTAAYALTVPDLDFRATTLKALLASGPALPPAEVARLTAQQLLAEGHKSCTPTYPEKPVVTDLSGLMTYGTHARSWGIKLKVNATSLSLVELDSGVSGIVLNPKDAKAAGVHPLSASTTGIYYGIADSIQVGDATFKDCPVRVAPADSLAGANSLIGTDFFRDRLIHIEYVNRTLTLTPYATPATSALDRSPAPEQKDWQPVYVAEGSFLIPTIINKTGPVVMLLDTGSYFSVYAPGPIASALGAKVDNAYPVIGHSGPILKVIPRVNTGDDAHALVLGPGGETLKLSIPNRNPDLRFANNEVVDRESISYDITPKSHTLGIELSGILGFSILHNYALDLDYRNNLVKLTLDPNHLYDNRENTRKN